MTNFKYIYLFFIIILTFKPFYDALKLFDQHNCMRIYFAISNYFMTFLILSYTKPIYQIKMRSRKENNIKTKTKQIK